MIAPDLNLLVYAYDTEAPRHNEAKTWWEGCLSTPEPIMIPWVVILGFSRVMTHPTINENPMTIQGVRTAISSWLQQAHVEILRPQSSTFKVFFDLLEEAGHGGNLSTDALIAAQALESRAVVHTSNLDFQRFKKLKTHYPLT